MRRDVLLAMASHIEKSVREEDFDMDQWLCGSVGCAVGHCAHLIPGLRIEQLNAMPGEALAPHFQHVTQMDAVALALDIPFSDADEIFSGCDYAEQGRDEHDDPCVTRAQVVERIREYVSNAS